MPGVPVYIIAHSSLKTNEIVQARYVFVLHFKKGCAYMPANYDEKAGSWTAQFYYTDYTGTRKKKFKRGFKLKKDAQEWERIFLEKQQANINMSFKSFVELYFEDMRHRLRASTVDNKRYIVDLKITPFFGQMQLSQIKAADVRRWQNEMISTVNDRTGKPYSATYLKSINNQLTAIFNYAVKLL